MVVFEDALVGAIQQGLCNLTRNTGNLARLSAQLWGAAGQDGVSAAGQNLANGLGAASDVFCNRPTRDLSGELTPPGQGGQCVGTRYQVEYDLNSPSLNIPGNSLSPPLYGPVKFLGVTFDSSTAEWVSTWQGTEPPAGAEQPGYPTELSDRRSNSLTRGAVTISNIDYVSVGGPDDCGDGPPTIPPYDPPLSTTNLPVNYDDSDGNPVSIDVPIIFGPGGIGNGNQFEVPFTVEVGPNIFINGNVNLSAGGVNIGLGGSDSGPVEIPEEEDVPLGTSLVGIRVLFTQQNAEKTGATERLGSGSLVPIWLPRLAAVRFEYESNGTRGWGPSKFAQALDSVIWAERPATDFNVTVERTSEYTVRKIVMNPDLFFNGGSGPGS